MRNLLATLLAMTFFSLTAYAQQSVEFTLAAGATAIDIDQLVEEDEISGSSANDWNVFSYGLSRQYIFATSGFVGFGGELMYHYLYWHEVRVPFGSQPIIRSYDTDAIRFSAFARLGADRNFAFDAGLNMNLLEETSVGVLLSTNYNINISDKVSIPLKVRMDIINGTVLTVPVTVNFGVKIKI